MVPIIIALGDEHFYSMLVSNPIHEPPSTLTPSLSFRSSYIDHSYHLSIETFSNRSSSSFSETSIDSIHEVDQTLSLRRLFPPVEMPSLDNISLQKLPPLRGPHSDQTLYPNVNNPFYLDLDATCFMMLILDLPHLFGVMVCPSNQEAQVRDFEEFNNWLNVISDPIVVKVYVGGNDKKRESFKFQLVNLMRSKFGLVLAHNNDSVILS